MKHTDISKINASLKGSEIIVCGWVRTFRDSKNISFCELNDGSTLKHLQVVIDKNVLDISNLPVGTSVAATGIVANNINNENVFELQAKRIEILGECPSDFPMQKKRHSLEFLRSMPHLRVRTNTFNAMFRLRSKLSFAIHRFFNENGFHYIHAPIITGSDCEGAGEVFKVTTIGFSNKFKTEEEYYAADFFNKKAGLTVSAQLEGEVAACALGKIYTFGPTFRAENSNTTRHAAEFWQIEPEVAFANINDIIEIAEKFIQNITSSILKECREELEFFEKHYEQGLIEKLENVAKSEFEKLDYAKAIEILQKSGEKFEFPVKWGLDLQTEHERFLTEKVFKKPVFVINYPKDIKSFYMKQNADGKTVAATDLLVPGVGEIIGCSEREADYDKLIAVLKERNMNIADYENYLELRKFGTVPHSGFGLGLERFLMYATGIGNIRDTILYPRTTGDLK